MTKRQEGVRKDVERFFGCLQGRFKIMRQERHEWSDSQLVFISQVFVILHNMLVKMAYTGELADEVDENGIRQNEMELLQEFFLVDPSHTEGTVDTSEASTGGELKVGSGISHLLERDRMVCSRERHIQLRAELSEHLWSMKESDVGIS